MRRFSKWFIGTCGLGVVFAAGFVVNGSEVQRAGPASELDGLRLEQARHYFSAESHLALAKGLLDRGDAVRAFFVCENARRTLFEAEEFSKAHRKYFRKPDPFDNSPEAERRLQAELRASPDDAKLLVGLADVYISRSDWDRARPLLSKARELRPDDSSIVFALAEIARRDGKPDDEKTLTDRFVADHPTDPASYRIRIGELAEKDPAAAAKLADEAVGKHPVDGDLRIVRARLAYSRRDDAAAGADFVEGARLLPERAFAQGQAGRFFLKGTKEPPRALPFYLRAYFLDPEYYDGEYAEGRIRSILYKTAQERLESVADLQSLLKDANPVVIGLAVEALGQEWNPKTLDGLYRLLSDDDVSLRWHSMTLIAKHPGPSTAERTELVRKEPDPRARGMGLYLVARTLGAKAMPILREALKSDLELIRYDALSALLMEGGEEGKANALEHLRSGQEPCGEIRQRLERAMAPKSPREKE